MPSEAEVMAAAAVAADFGAVEVVGHFAVAVGAEHFGVAVDSAEEDLMAVSAGDSAADALGDSDVASGAATDSSSASGIRPGIGLVTDTTDIPTLMGILMLMGILTHPTDTMGMTTAASQHTHRVLVIRSLLPLAAA
jgi:hypothetical protein